MIRLYPKTKTSVITTKSWNSSSPPTNPTVSKQNIILNGSVEGVDNPRWVQQVKDGVSATTPLTGISQKCELSSGELSYRMHQIAAPHLWVAYEASGNLVGVPIDPLADGLLSAGTADAKALSALSDKLSDRNRMVESITILGELAKTVRMIKKPAKALREAVDDYYVLAKRRTRYGKPHSVRRVLSETWLESTYGWRPLMRDLENIGDYLNLEKRRAFVSRKRVRARGVEERMSSSYSGGLAAGVAAIRYCTTVKRVASVRYIVCHETTAPALQSLDCRMLGFEPSSFIPQLWELAPWSFLVDYFTNIGQVISALSYGSNGVRWVVKGILQENTRHTSDGKINWDALKNASQTFDHNRLVLGPTLRTYRKVQRSGYAGSLVPTLILKTPDVGSLKWLNIAALVSARS